MSGTVIDFVKQQKYRFDFGTDDKLYVIIFNGKIPQVQIKNLISAIQNCLYKKMSEAISFYLRQNNLEYSNLCCIEIPLEKNEVIGWASYLLNSETYEKVDENLENADFYYAVMDCQENTQTYSEGCYFTVQRSAWGNREFQHNAIVQTYFCNKETCDEYGHFALRKTRGNILYTIDSSEGEPVLPTFGCVDMMALLADIENINSKEDAINTAIK